MAIGVIARYAHAEPSSPPRGANREMMMGRVLAFGEIMLRLSPPNRELLLQTPHLDVWTRSEEHTSELQSLMRISYAVFCLKKKTSNQRSCKNIIDKSHKSTTNHMRQH